MMRKSSCAALTLILSLSLLTSSALARAEKPTPTPTLKQQLNMTPRTFLGGFFLQGDYDNWNGTLEADNPKCVLTVPSSLPVRNGLGPNGSLLLTGGPSCAGNFQLFLAGGINQFILPTEGGVGNNTGVYSGPFVIVQAPSDPTQQGTTVEWAGTYTQVYNINPAASSLDSFCGSLNFCANLGPNYGAETFNSEGLSFLLELNGFTFDGPNQ
jgi:hypothetical protein